MTSSLAKYTPHVSAAILASAVAIGVGSASVYFDINFVLAGIVVIALIGIIMKNPLVGMYLLIFFLPFERIGSVDIAGSTIRISQIIAIVTIIVWIVRGLALKKFKFRQNPSLFLILTFIAINVVGLTNTENFQRSLLVLGFTIFTIAISLAIPNIVRQRNQVNIVIQVLLFSALLVSAFGIYQFLGDLIGLPTSLTGLREQYTKNILGFPRVQSTALEPLYFANYLLIPLGVAISLFLSKASKIKTPILLTVIALGGLNLVLTVSRGGYIAFTVMLGLLCIIYLKQVIRPRVIISALVILTLVSVVAVRFLNAEEQFDTFTEHVGNIFGGASYVERVDTFNIAHRIWLEHPLVGIGPGGFGPYASYHPLITPSDGFRIVNNEYIELLAETGIFGLMAYILMILIILIRSVKAWRVAKNDNLKAILVGLVTAYVAILVQYNTFSILYIVHIWALIGLIIAVQNLLIHPPEISKPKTADYVEIKPGE